MSSLPLRLFVTLLALALPLGGAGVGAEEMLRPFGRGSWQEILRTHSGRPTVVHFWGLSCGPCRVEMPHWGELLRERKDLNLVLVHSDLIPNEARAVSAMLAKSGLAAAENWMFQDSFVERLRFEIDPTWQGEIPMTLLVARDGTTSVISGVVDLAKLRAWLDAQAKAPR